MTKHAQPSQVDAENLRVNERKWSKPLMDAGWNVIPNVIIEKQAALGLDAIDMNIIVHLSHYWWQPENLPRPSVETIAKAIGVTPRTIQKRIKALHELELVTREERRHTKHGSVPNLYSFKGLIEAALPYAQEKLAEKAAHMEAKKKRLERKRPKLVVDNEA
jgi:predicted transcriptional regulator